MPLSLNEVLTSPSYRGLSSLDAEVKIKEYGKNVRPRHKRKNPFKRIWGIVAQPMLLLLSATAAIYYFLGTHLESIILALSIIPIVLVEFFQESRTDKAIEILDSMMVEECSVMRDGVVVKLSSTEIVPGDLVYLSAGDKIPADGVIIQSPGLMVDESTLTGESIPVIKTRIKNVGENNVFQGTMVVQGEGQMVVAATGEETTYGKLGNLLEGIVEEPTPLQRKIEKLVKEVAVGAIIVALFIGIVLGQRQGLIRGILGTLTIAMSIIPEEFPIVFSVFLIMGVWRLSKRKALVRKMVMVETLGSATVICTDKTGTLTEGKMSLEKVYFDGKIIDVKREENVKIISPLIQTAVLALEKVAVDPMEIEMQRFAKENKIIPENFHSNFQIKKDGAFDASTKMVHHIWQYQGDDCVQYTAGAPEMVIDNCEWEKPSDKEEVEGVYKEYAGNGYRIVAIAKTTVHSCEEFSVKNLCFAGLIILSDPPRAGVKEAVDICYKAGIRVVMITGDHALTAKSIADQVGLKSGAGIVEGKDLDGLSQDSLHALIQKNNIFARVRPEQKYMIVEALQAEEQIVAMTGDGVNDAPALKKANIGIAMGQKGTDVARAASGIVLLDDNFTTIVKAVEEGRRVYENLRKAFLFLFSFHLPIIGLAIIPLLLGHDLYFLPIHIIFLEFFADRTTVLGLERDPLSKGAMLQPPRPTTEPLVNRNLWWQIGWQAAGILGLSLWFYGFGLWNGNLTLGRTMSFMALVFSQLILMLVNRDWHQVKQNYVLTFLLLFTFGCLNVALFVPEVRELFHFSTVSTREYGMIFGAAVIAMIFFNKVAKTSWSTK